MELNLMPVGYNLLPEKFTISELEKLYETILVRKLGSQGLTIKNLNTGGIDLLISWILQLG